MDITLGGVEPATMEDRRLSLVAWGPAGLGKTTLACTMPGRKCLINFDPDGPSSLPPAALKEVTVFDFSGKEDSFFTRLSDTDPFGLEKVMEHFDSFVFDSLSSITERTLARGINITKGATLERPSPGAYAARNNLAINLIRNALAITGRHKKHVAFIAHEGAPEKNDDGMLLGYTMSLGGQLPNQVALRINEVWPMFEDSKNRKMIICRKARLRDPAKSRMFITSPGDVEFEWKFDPTDWNNEKNMRIDQWFEAWKENGFNKIPFPK